MRVLYLLAGTVSLLLGVFFLFVPIVPTVPFIAVALYCFAQYSAAVHRRVKVALDFAQTRWASISERARRRIKFGLLFYLFAAFIAASVYLWQARF